MDCLVAPVQVIKQRFSYRFAYRVLEEEDEDFGFGSNFVTVVVGKEKREFRVDPFVLQEIPFRVLIDLVNGNTGQSCRESFRGGGNGEDRVVLVDVDAILFEHMLWLMTNDSSSLFNLNLNLKEIVDFYSLEN